MSLPISFCIITNGKRPDKTALELESIRNLGIPQYEVIVSGFFESKLPPGVKYLPLPHAAHNGQLGAMRNHAVRSSRAPLTVVADDDMIFHPGFYGAIQSSLKKAAFVTTQLLNVDGTRYWDWATFGGPGGHHLLDYWEQDPHIYITGGLCIGWRDAILEVGWDEDRGIDRMEDVDFSRRLQQKNFKHIFCSHAVVTHNDSAYYQIDQVISRTVEPESWTQVAEGIDIQGAYRASGFGLIPLRPECVLRISSKISLSSSYLQLEFQTLPDHCLLHEPLVVSINYGQQVLRCWEFPRGQNIIECVIPLPSLDSSQSDTLFNLSFSSFSVPYLRDNPTDRRAYSLFLKGVFPIDGPKNEYQATVVVTPPSLKKGVFLLAPLMQSSTTGITSRVLLNSLMDSSLLVESEAYATDLTIEKNYSLESSYDDRWITSCGEQIFEGTLIIVASLLECSAPHFLHRHRQRIKKCQQAVLVVTDTETSYSYIPRLDELFDAIWVVSFEVGEILLQAGALLQPPLILPSSLFKVTCRRQGNQSLNVPIIVSFIKTGYHQGWIQALDSSISEDCIWLLVPWGTAEERNSTKRRIYNIIGSEQANQLKHPFHLVEEGLSFPLFQEILAFADSYLHLGALPIERVIREGLLSHSIPYASPFASLPIPSQEVAQESVRHLLSLGKRTITPVNSSEVLDSNEFLNFLLSSLSSLV